MTEDASVGIIFPLFFSIAVILITRYARNVHLDTEVVLIGEIILAPLHRIKFPWIKPSKGFDTDEFCTFDKYCIYSGFF